VEGQGGEESGVEGMGGEVTGGEGRGGSVVESKEILKIDPATYP